jgi:tetratricopeptide (TPR) repeat protein
MLGDWRASLETLSLALAATRAQDLPALHHHGRITQGYLLLVHSDVEEATAILQDELTAEYTGKSPRSVALAQASLAEKDLLRGAPELARDRLEPLLPSLETSTDELIDPLRVLARVRLAHGDVQGAESLIDRCAGLVAQTRSRLGFAEVLWIRGMVRAVQHRPAEAIHLFEAALSLLHTTPFPFLEGRILLAWGMVDAENGAIMEARHRLESALERFQQSGALAYAPLAEAALLALGTIP